jgi:hypothetical protein
VPVEDQRFPMPCGPCADQGYHDHGWLRSRPVADAFGAPVLRDQGPIGRPGTARSILALEYRELEEALSDCHQRPVAQLMAHGS